jgi:hypothetical protein
MLIAMVVKDYCSESPVKASLSLLNTGDSSGNMPALNGNFSLNSNVTSFVMLFTGSCKLG